MLKKTLIELTTIAAFSAFAVEPAGATLLSSDINECARQFRTQLNLW
jgi:hypothetical protein